MVKAMGAVKNLEAQSPGTCGIWGVDRLLGELASALKEGLYPGCLRQSHTQIGRACGRAEALSILTVGDKAV
jgi:hypothetical protein